MLKAIYNKIRLLRLRSREPYSVYYKILGFMPNDLSVYEQAFLHRSSSIRTDKGKWINNERLEFLGDAVLDTIVADVVFHRFETKKEGFLTNTRSKIVQRETLNKLAIELGLDKLVVSSTRSSSHNNYMYGNAFEAFIGAIYIDQGYDVCKHFVEERVIAPYINLSQIARKEVNFKSKMIEWSQKNKVEIDFRLIESFTDNENNPVFQTQLYVLDVPGGIGTGYSKKESQQNAAKATLRRIQTEKEFQDAIEAAKERLAIAVSGEIIEENIIPDNEGVDESCVIAQEALSEQLSESVVPSGVSDENRFAQDEEAISGPELDSDLPDDEANEPDEKEDGGSDHSDEENKNN